MCRLTGYGFTVLSLKQGVLLTGSLEKTVKAEDEMSSFVAPTFFSQKSSSMILV